MFELSGVRVIRCSSYPGFELSGVRVIRGSSYPGFELSGVQVIRGSSYLFNCNAPLLKFVLTHTVFIEFMSFIIFLSSSIPCAFEC